MKFYLKEAQIQEMVFKTSIKTTKILKSARNKHYLKKKGKILPFNWWTPPDLEKADRDCLLEILKINLKR